MKEKDMKKLFASLAAIAMLHGAMSCRAENKVPTVKDMAAYLLVSGRTSRICSIISFP